MRMLTLGGMSSGSITLVADDVFFTLSEPELHDDGLHKVLDQAIAGDAERSYLGRGLADELARRKVCYHVVWLVPPPAPTLPSLLALAACSAEGCR